MTELAVELPHGQAKIEWNKLNPTFREVKEKLQNSGISKDWCIEVLRNEEFITPDDNWRMKNMKKISLRVAPINDRRIRERTSIGLSNFKSPITFILCFLLTIKHSIYLKF